MRSHIVGNLIRRIPVLAVLGPLRLTRNVVRALGLIKEDNPAVSIPQRLKPLEMLNEQSISSDIIAVDDETIRGRIESPSGGINTVVRTPYPHVVDDDILRVDHDAAGCFRYWGSTTNPTRNIKEGCGVGTVIDSTDTDIADLQEIGRVGGTRIEEDASDRNTINVCNDKSRSALSGRQCRQSNSEDDGIGIVNDDRLRKVVNAGSKEQMSSTLQCEIESQRSIEGRLGNIEPADRDRRRSESGRAIPTGPLTVLFQGRNNDGVIVGIVDGKVWLFADNGCICNNRKRRPRRARRIRVANENHIPHPTIPITPLSVASDILLLTSRDHVVIDNCISNKTATRVIVFRRSRSEVEELEISLVMTSAKPRSLRCRKHCRVGIDSRGDGEIFNSAPEILRRISCVPCRSDIHAASNCHVVRDAAKAVNGGVKANLDICAVGTGFEEECVTLWTELVGLLSCEDGIDLRLNICHGGIEDQNVGTKVDGTAIGGKSFSIVRYRNRDTNSCDACGRHLLLRISGLKVVLIVLSERRVCRNNGAGFIGVVVNCWS